MNSHFDPWQQRGNQQRSTLLNATGNNVSISNPTNNLGNSISNHGAPRSPLLPTGDPWQTPASANNMNQNQVYNQVST